MNRLNLNPKVILSLLCILALSACARAQFKEPIAKYQESVAKATGVVGAYYTDINQVERDSYLAKAAVRGEPVGESDPVSKHPTPLVYSYYPQQDIKLRLDLLKGFGVLGQRLAELANSGAPEAIGPSFAALGTQFDSLAKAFEQAGGATNTSYFGPVSGIAALLLGEAAQAGRDATVAQFIKDSKPKVDAAFDLLKTDLKNISERYVDMYYNRLTDLCGNYNDSLRGGRTSYKSRTVLLAEINAVARVLESARMNNPVELVNAMQDAYNELYKYSLSYNKVDSPAKFVSAVNAASAFVSSFAEQAVKIKPVQ